MSHQPTAQPEPPVAEQRRNQARTLAHRAGVLVAAGAMVAAAFAAAAPAGASATGTSPNGSTAQNAASGAFGQASLAPNRKRPRPTPTPTPPPTIGGWSTTGSMTTPRQDQTSALLTNGRVLVASGSSSEVYNPATGTWTAAARPAFATYGDAATTLTDGRVLVIGASTTNPGGITKSQFYNPATNTWTLGPNLPLSLVTSMSGRFPNGRVIVAGTTTLDYYPTSAAAEYNPATNSWTTLATPPIVTEWGWGPGAARILPNGDFFTTLGANAPAVYNRATNTWRQLPTPPTPLATRSVIALLPSGNVMIAGGSHYEFVGSSPSFSVSEVNPISGVWTTDASLPRASIWGSAYWFDGSALAQLGNGSILATGGQSDSDLDYVYSTQTKTWTAVPGRNAHDGSLTTLTNGSVLSAGGLTGTRDNANVTQRYPGDPTAHSVIYTP